MPIHSRIISNNWSQNQKRLPGIKLREQDYQMPIISESPQNMSYHSLHFGNYSKYTLKPKLLLRSIILNYLVQQQKVSSLWILVAYQTLIFKNQVPKSILPSYISDSHWQEPSPNISKYPHYTGNTLNPVNRHQETRTPVRIKTDFHLQ